MIEICFYYFFLGCAEFRFLPVTLFSDICLGSLPRMIRLDLFTYLLLLPAAAAKVVSVTLYSHNVFTIPQDPWDFPPGTISSAKTPF